MSQAKAVKSILTEAIRHQLAKPVPTDDRLEAARQARRCMHVRANGVRCGSPAMRQNAFCFFHDRLYNLPAEESFPFLEDAASIQMAIMQVLDGLRRGKLEPKVANSLLFGLQTASSNLKRALDNLQPVPSRSSPRIRWTPPIPPDPRRPDSRRPVPRRNDQGLSS
ncbi:MAG: hypothetical protein M3O85_04165 [Acidobacteriota bacterium]|nr:hypothetical protein [Acidobacteriota bacterium]